MARRIVIKTLGATVIALAAALATSVLTARFVPARSDLAFAIAAHVFVPLWAGLACVMPLLGRRR